MSFDPILKAAVEHYMPAGLIYVGSSNSDTTQLWPFADSRNPIWISLSSDLHEKIKQQPQKFENITPYFEYVSKQAGAIDFYDASLSEFSGNINPAVLKPYWQNIKTVKTTKRTVTTLDKLYSQNSKIHNAWLSANWLIIDQLAALDTMKGGQAFLPQLDGMIIKVFLPDGSPCTPELATSSKEQISKWLELHNFTAVVQKNGRHKSFAHILFVRNWKAEYESLSIKFKDLQAQKDEAKAEYEKQLNKAQTNTALNSEIKDLKSQLAAVQDDNLQKEKLAKLHLQNLDFLREKFKDMKKKYDGNVELLKNVQAKLLSVVQSKSTQRSGSNTAEKLK